MKIIGIGTDIVNIERIRSSYSRFSEVFLQKNFHKEEIEKFYQLNEKHNINYLAKRFAAKEAVAKAFGKGIGELAFKDMAILNDEHGSPYVKIDSNNNYYTSNLKIDISLSDEEPFAIAFVVISR